ncbi:MAG: 3-oxoacyl-[Acyl-carrier-protein] reductase [Candidatus Tokpelaia sp. JSC085]|nr:MAG: 3-oxoacyl-[Acyl-carrier-protein] reductase [Candidatus Tokpelaia sp. JSC085]
MPVALITGGAKRIGAAIAADLALHGFTIAIHYERSAHDSERLCRKILANGGDAIPFHHNLLERNPAALIEKVQKMLGPVELLVNNASLFNDDGIGHFDKNIWDGHFTLHVCAPVLLADAMHARLPPDKQGLIINMIDQRVWRLNPRFFSYTLSKSALWTATQTLAQALAPHIRVNAIGPGPSLKSARQNDEDFIKQKKVLLLGHGPFLPEFGQTIRYLWAMSSVTGQMIALDGGQHLMWQTQDMIEQVE